MLPSSDRRRNAADRIRARPFYPGSRLIFGRVASVAIRLSRSLGGAKLNPSRFKLRRSTGEWAARTGAAGASDDGERIGGVSDANVTSLRKIAT
jgi:hypothetical protein